jgi:hypothetical protein
MAVRHETPVEYFKGLVESALGHQNVEAEELTSFYLVHLLCGFVAPGRGPHPADSKPLAMWLGEALESGGQEQRARLRRLGDTSLFISGYFAESLHRKLVDVDYYVSVGGYAYGSLSRDGDAFAPVFAELSERFVTFVDVLSEVSEQAGLTSNRDLLRLYERWLRTGSRRTGQALADRGLVPSAAIGSRFLQ